MKRSNDQLRGAAQAIAVAVTIALLSGAVKLYNDVQELRIRFNYVNGDWKPPR
jgi:hypothetical protein